MSLIYDDLRSILNQCQFDAINTSPKPINTREPFTMFIKHICLHMYWIRQHSLHIYQKAILHVQWGIGEWFSSKCALNKQWWLFNPVHVQVDVLYYDEWFSMNALWACSKHHIHCFKNTPHCHNLINIKICLDFQAVSRRVVHILYLLQCFDSPHCCIQQDKDWSM